MTQLHSMIIHAEARMSSSVKCAFPKVKHIFTIGSSALCDTTSHEPHENGLYKSYLHSSKQAEICFPLEHAFADSSRAVRADPVYGALFLLELIDLQLVQNGGICGGK